LDLENQFGIKSIFFTVIVTLINPHASTSTIGVYKAELPDVVAKIELNHMIVARTYA